VGVTAGSRSTRKKKSVTRDNNNNNSTNVVCCHQHFQALNKVAGTVDLPTDRLACRKYDTELQYDELVPALTLSQIS
jgi:hypothetical protein